VNESPAVTFASHRVLVPVTVALPFVTLDSPVEYCDIINPYLLTAHVYACDHFNVCGLIRPHDGLHALSNHIAHV